METFIAFFIRQICSKNITEISLVENGEQLHTYGRKGLYGLN
jgi:hypothetical protein